MTVDDLRDDAKLTEWLIERFNSAGLPASRYAMTRGFACAQLALADSNQPAHLFVLLITEGLRRDWENLSAAEVEFGEKRYINSRLDRTSWDTFCRSAANELNESAQVGTSMSGGN